ncbi:MAG: alanine--tRNA ligase-related protein [Anaerovoracaceae bacterium]
MNTIKIFQDNVYEQNCTATITEILLDNKDSILTLDKTIFFPTGGGQSCDLGNIGDYPLTEVYEKDNIVYHKLKGKTKFKVGDSVLCTLDWDRRFDNMQRHCGEHILSGIFFSKFGGINRGFHMGSDYMTVDISLEANPEFTQITWDMAMEAELYTNQVIWSNAPVTVRRFQKREDAEKLPLRKALAIDEEISIVCVGDTANAADCVACCGTHPATAGQVGLVKIYKLENHKGMFRIYFEAGKRALIDYNKKHALINRLNQKYSAGDDDLLKKISAQEDKISQIRSQLFALRKSIVDKRIKDIRQELQDKNSQPFVLRRYDDMEIKDLLSIGRPLIEESYKPVLIVSPKENTVLLFSSGAKDCGKLVKENANIYRGKGGGTSTSARAMFPDKDCLDTYIDLLRKHLT